MISASKLPRISLITACYNSQATIRRTLQSALAQTGEFELEHLIQDGGSSDGTVAILEEYAHTAKYRVAISSEPDAGFYDAINKALARVTGEIVGLINADDWLADEHVLQDIVRVFRDASSLDAIYADLDYVRIAPGSPTFERPGHSLGSPYSGGIPPQASPPSPSISPLPSQSWRFVVPRHHVVRHWVAGRRTGSSFKNGWMPPHPTVYVRRGVYQQLGGYRLDMSSAADYEWMVRVFEKHRISAAYLPRVTVKMLNGGQSNSTVLARLLANRNDRKAWKINGLKPFPWFSLAKPARKLRQFLSLRRRGVEG